MTRRVHGAERPRAGIPRNLRSSPPSRRASLLGRTDPSLRVVGRTRPPWSGTRTRASFCMIDGGLESSAARRGVSAMRAWTRSESPDECFTSDYRPIACYPSQHFNRAASERLPRLRVHWNQLFFVSADCSGDAPLESVDSGIFARESEMILP